MRCLAALLLTGFFSLLASCSDSTTDSCADAGLPFDGLRACIDTCVIAVDSCMQGRDDCGIECVRQFANAGPQCQDELDAMYACALPVRQAQGPLPHCPNIVPLECEAQRKAVVLCVQELGCFNGVFDASFLGPNGEEGCRGEQQCAHTDYIAECWLEGTTQVCDCSSLPLGVDAGAPTHVGMCEDPGFCGPFVFDSCCNQFFKIFQ